MPKEIKGNEWDRRKEDEHLRDDLKETLGSVKTAIGLFEKNLNDVKAHCELRGDQLADKIQEHEDLLNGNAKEEGFFQWMHQADRNIKALIKGVLGEDGANHEKSLKGQLAKLQKDFTGLDNQLIGIKLSLESIESARATNLTRRGQNVAIWLGVISLIGTLAGVVVKEVAPKWWDAKILRKPAVAATTRTPAKRSRMPKRVPKYVPPPIESPEEDEPAETPPVADVDSGKPTPAPLNPY